MKADLLTLVAALQRLAVRPWEDRVSLDEYAWLCQLLPAFGARENREMAEAGTLTVATVLGLFAPALLYTEGGNTRPSVGGAAVTVDVNGFDVMDKWARGVVAELRDSRALSASLTSEVQRLESEVKRLTSVGRWVPGHLAGLGMTRAQRRSLMRAVVAAFDVGAGA